MIPGVMAEFSTPEALVAAARELRARGYRELDAFTPYPVHGLEQALGLRRSPLNWLVLPFAAFGAGAGYLVQWLCNAVDYPLNVGGRPPNSAPAFIPVTFEMGVLAGSLAAIVILFGLCRLPELSNPLFAVDGFERASIDRFWLAIGEADPALDPGAAARELELLGAARVIAPIAEAS